MENNFGVHPAMDSSGSSPEQRAKDAAMVSRLLKNAYAENIPPIINQGGEPSPIWLWLFADGPKPGQ